MYPMSQHNTFEDYLAEKMGKKQLMDYLSYCHRFTHWLTEENLTANTCRYADLLSYVKRLQDSKSITAGTINNYLRAIRYYYDYLESIEESDYNPAKRLKIKGQETLPNDLLSKRELNTIYVDYKAETNVQKRNKILLGLAIYQGLPQREIERLSPSDIDLVQCTVEIRQKGRSRTLKLAAHQILPLQEYITEILPKLREQTADPNGQLIQSTGSSEGIKEMICDLNKTLRKQYPRYKNLIQVRSSVISHWVESYNIVKAQYLAGHRYIKTTERYKRVNMKELKEALDRYHPIASAQTHPLET